MARFSSTLLLAFVALASALPACAADPALDDVDGELGASQDEVREVVAGPAAKATDAEVWAVENQWADRATPNARKPGLAWPENSGLSWEEKYQRWIGAFEKIDATRVGGWGQTIRLQTPYGRTIDGPVLECADVSIWLRATFAAWYRLPFFMTGWRNGQVIYFGHFGVVDRNGDPVSGFPRFRTAHRDHEATWRSGDRWPTDARLRAMRVGPDDAAEGVKVGDVPLPAGAGAGAYFDELFLNKRAGALMVALDANFGSANLADGANMFHLRPEGTRPGDALVERWQRRGIGHTLPVMTAVTLPNGKMRVTLASGSMPRRQPVWETEAMSAGYFKKDASGGPGTTSDGEPYAKLGGGVRRFRTAVLTGGRWNNVVPAADRADYIPDSDLGAIAARTERFATLLAEDSPEAARDAALAVIQSAREALRTRPASCSQRTKREDAFKDLYAVMERSFGLSAAQVDAQYRQLEDYVLAELEYNRSKTCCWNSTTAAMGEIVLDHATKEKQANEARGVCQAPTVFRASGGGGYDVFARHAASLGRAAEWRAWTEDEPCTQRDVVEDALTEAGRKDMCTVPPAAPPEPPSP